MQYEIRSFRVLSLLRSMPLVFLVIGLLVGIFIFLIAPTGAIAGIGFGTRILSWLIFSIIYAIVLTISVCLIALFYNFVVKKIKIKGIEFNLEQKQAQQ